MTDQDDAAGEALCLITRRCPRALGAVLGGSSAQGRVAPSSDLDIAALLPDSDTSRREIIRYGGRLAELFMHTLAAGPIQLTPTEWERGRYLLTCFMDDLIDTPPADRYEQLSLADATLREAAHLLTAHHGAWNGIGEWLPADCSARTRHAARLCSTAISVCRSFETAAADYGRAMALFHVERVTPIDPVVAWRRLTAWERHGDVVPLTRIVVSGAQRAGEGTVFVARSGVGPLAFDDPMEVVVWQPPEEVELGVCRLVKRGSFVRGWAEIHVRPESGGGSRVVWREELRVRGIPRAFDPVVGRVASRVFGRAVDALLRRE